MIARFFSVTDCQDTPRQRVLLPPIPNKKPRIWQDYAEKSESWQTHSDRTGPHLLAPGPARMAPAPARMCADLAASLRGLRSPRTLSPTFAAPPCSLAPRTGPVTRTRCRRPATCRAAGCQRPARNRGLCWKHYRRERASRPGTRKGYDAGRTSPRWVGDNLASYGSAHERIVRERGAASLYACTMPGCHARAEQWALRPDAARAISDATGTWSPEAADYTPLCQTCHSAMDAATRAARNACTQPLPADWAHARRSFNPPTRWTQHGPPAPEPPAPAAMPATADLLELLAKEEQ